MTARGVFVLSAAWLACTACAGKLPETRYYQLAPPAVATQARSALQADARTDAQADARTDTRTDAQSDAQSEKRAALQADARTDTRTDAQSEKRTDARTEKRAELRTDARPDAQAEKRAELQADTRAEALPDAQAEKRAARQADAQAETETRAEAHTGRTGALLVLDALSTDAAYDDERIVYRTTPFRLDYYHYHRWSSAPGNMVGSYLAQALEATGRFRGVVRDVTPDALVMLGGRVVALEEVDRSRTAWAGRIVLELLLSDARSGEALWTERLEETEPLRQQSPEGLAAALSIALSRIVARIAPVIADLTERQARRNAAPTDRDPRADDARAGYPGAARATPRAVLAPARTGRKLGP